MANIQRILAGVAARMLGRLLDGLSDGDTTWLARTLYKDRDSGPAVGLEKFARAYHEIFYRNSSGDIAANGEIALLSRFAGHRMRVALDVGANVGGWTRAMKAACPDIAIHAFEIMPETAAEMRRNIAGLTDVHLHELGLGDSAGEIDIWYSTINNVMTSAFQARTTEFTEFDGTWQAVRGKIMRGDDYLAAQGIDHVDFLKIDVEGMEMHVLNGFSDSLAARKVDIVQFEYAPLNKFIPLLLRDLYEYFTSRGFVVGKIYPKGVLFKPYEADDEDFLGLTYIACPGDRPDLLERLGYRR